MKATFLPMPQPIDNTPRIAEGWVFNPKNSTMELYQNGTIIGFHLCQKKYSHDIYECHYYGFKAG